MARPRNSLILFCHFSLEKSGQENLRNRNPQPHEEPPWINTVSTVEQEQMLMVSGGWSKPRTAECFAHTHSRRFRVPGFCLSTSRENLEIDGDGGFLFDTLCQKSKVGGRSDDSERLICSWGPDMAMHSSDPSPPPSPHSSGRGSRPLRPVSSKKGEGMLILD